MNVKLKVLRKVLEEAIDNIDAGNSNHSDDEHADFNLWRRTCRMISGEVVLPNTPVIEGYASYNPCHIQSTTPAPAA
jgi:hypothetical protein